MKLTLHDVCDLRVSLHSASSDYCVSFRDYNGLRYHVWLAHKTRTLRDDARRGFPILYQRGSEGAAASGRHSYAVPKYLKATAVEHAPLVDGVIRRCREERLFEAADAALAAAEAHEAEKRSARARELRIEGLAPRMYALIERLNESDTSGLSALGEEAAGIILEVEERLPAGEACPPPEYSVVVGNIGTVYGGPDAAKARETYEQYVADSQADFGRASGESVTLFKDIEIEAEHAGTQTEEEN